MSRWPGEFGFHDGGPGERVGDEFQTLLADADEAVGLDAATLPQRLAAVGRGVLPPDHATADRLEPDLFFWIEGKVVMFFTVMRDESSKVEQALALRFCLAARGRVRVADLWIARERCRRAHGRG